MEKHETKGTNLQLEVLDPVEQSQSNLLGKWTSATYSTSEEMLEVIGRVASGRFKWKIRASHYFDEAISFAKWGWNCKRLKRCKIKCSSDKNCSFDVNIKLNLETSKYIFVVINENHCNHEVKALGKIKKYAQQLTTEELKMIKQLGVAVSGIAAADVALHRNFPGTLFDLTWDYPKEGKVILNGVSFQEDLQNKFKKVHGDSIQVDTTHGMSRYRLVAMIPCGIDCFRTTINFGCSMMESDASKNVVKGLKLLGFQDAEVIMTDGSKALEAAVEELGESHVLCRKHYLATLNSETSGLKGTKKIKFTSNLGGVLTVIFSEEKELDQLIENMLVEYPEEPQQVALKILRKTKTKCDGR
eukprot:augustus_masked-scaffold_56-processed-gene-1.86-mRNA-1 protein AED:1.00 eAED:1.00 QI:0/0/0/0/1/1/2/0/357